MKKIFLSIICVLLFISAADAKRYIVTVENTNRARINWDGFVSRAGGEVVETFDFIDGALLDLPEEQAKRIMDRRAPGMTIEEDEVVYWLNQNSATGELKKYSKKYRKNSPAKVSAAENVYVGGDGIKSSFPMEGEMPWGVARLKPNALWKITEGDGVKVAVIDTGINFNHPDLKANYAGGYNAIRPGSSAMDDQGHGTHVAGSIAAAKDGEGVVGVAPKAKLYGVKAMAKDGTGDISTMVRAVQWTIDNKMNIVNMSISVDKDYEALRKAIKRAYDAGITVVCSAGNDSGPVNIPAKYPFTIAVSASDPADFSAVFTSKGPEVDVMAPGMYVLSTSMDGKYQEMNGTSQAAPHISGLAALAYSLGYTEPEQIREVIRKSAEIAEFATTEEQGAGIPNASKIRKLAQ